MLIMVWVNFIVSGMPRSLPILATDSKICSEVLDYFRRPSICGRSPSFLAEEGRAIRDLCVACRSETSADDGGYDPWRWAAGVERLYAKMSRDTEAKLVLREARPFLAYLVLEGVLPATGAGLAALIAVAVSTKGNLQATEFASRCRRDDEVGCLLVAAKSRLEGE